MSEEVKFYPKGQLALDNGDLLDVTDVKHEITNGGKHVHTLRGHGVTGGNEETTVSFDAVVSEDGFERDYLAMVKKRKIKKLRLKLPGETLTIHGMATKRSVEVKTDDAVKYTIEFIGRTED